MNYLLSLRTVLTNNSFRLAQISGFILYPCSSALTWNGVKVFPCLRSTFPWWMWVTRICRGHLPANPPSSPALLPALQTRPASPSRLLWYGGSASIARLPLQPTPRLPTPSHPSNAPALPPRSPKQVTVISKMTVTCESKRQRIHECARPNWVYSCIREIFVDGCLLPSIFILWG